MKINSTAVVGAASALAGVGVGSVVTFYVTRKKLRAEYDERLEGELAATRAHYARLEKKDDAAPVSPVKVLLGDDSVDDETASAAVIAMESYTASSDDRPDPRQRKQKIAYNKVPPETEEAGVVKTEEVEVTTTTNGEEVTTFTTELRQEVRSSNVFHESIKAEDDEDFSYEEELAKRASNPNEPHILHHDEFMQNLPDYEQSILTYFEADDTLVDDKNTPIANEHKLVGIDSLARFGHGSKDEHVVYVRNPRLQIDFEITRSIGSYAQEVLGVDDSHLRPQSAARRPPTKFRTGDDG